MEKKKRWQFYLILAVILLTIYNISPTLIYYSKPLKENINEKRASTISSEIIKRVNSLEENSVAWLKSFCKHIKTTPISIEVQKNNLKLIKISFRNEKEMKRFQKLFPTAGAQIQFVPAQLKLTIHSTNEKDKSLLVSRKIGTHFEVDKKGQFFKFGEKFTNGQVGEFYHQIVNDRASYIALNLVKPSLASDFLEELTQKTSNQNNQKRVLALAKEIVEIETNFKQTNIAKRFYASFTQNNLPNKQNQIDLFKNQINSTKTTIETEIKSLTEKQQKERKENQFIPESTKQKIENLQKQKEILEKATTIITKNIKFFTSGKSPISKKAILQSLDKTFDPRGKPQKLNLGDYNLFVNTLIIDWKNDSINIELHNDVQKILTSTQTTETQNFIKNKLNQLVINEIARVAQSTNEKISPHDDEFIISLSSIPGSKSFLAFDLTMIAQTQIKNITTAINNIWSPQSIDFAKENFPIFTYDEYQKLPAEQKKLGLVIYSPTIDKPTALSAFRKSSIYIIAKGINSIFNQYKNFPDTKEKQTFLNDFEQLSTILQQDGFFGYPGSAYNFPDEFKNDIIFELDNFYGNVLKASREDFVVHGSQRFGILEFSDVEQRITTINKIENEMQEDLLKWRDQYNAAQVNIYQPYAKYEVAPLTKNIYIENFKLSCAKYFRGNPRKILRWGLDLSGGKIVTIGLRDQNNQIVTNSADLSEAVNELYKRVNKMGVSEVEIREQGSNIILNFPGSQTLSAAELVQASAMYFHIVNEQFSTNNPDLAENVNNFLQGVWNEAVVTNKKDVYSINKIAYNHLGGMKEDGIQMPPISEDAKILHENGLRLANPEKPNSNSSFDDSISKIAILRQENFSESQRSFSPLMIIFNNYALEGSSLDKVQPGYDPSKGNRIDFTVSGSITKHGQKINPRKDFYIWTSQYAEEKVKGTPKEEYSHGNGWRMAIILNDEIISSPNLAAALRDHASITGRFSQREVNKLVADLKAGSLTYTPHILSEQNVSADLGHTERYRGILATSIGLLLVISIMIGYYHFGGIIASIAIVFNLLIMWGVLQNIDAVLSLPGIAGIILTVGMAVDANVLVFERIREEFNVSGRIASAISAGYRKAFSAIIDSNITTIIAAFILLNFDSGPIKGFAITLIIGIISSMFTALFMTKYFFVNWAKNSNHKSLSMMNIFTKPNFDFLSKFKGAIVIALAIIAIGSTLFFTQKQAMLGMDFTGGFVLSVNLEEKQDINYRKAIQQALIKQGAAKNNFEIKELNIPTNLRIQFGASMEMEGQPFYQMPLETKATYFSYPYENNPRITWIVNAIQKAGLTISPLSLEDLDKNWSSISGQLSDVMRNQALIGLLLALIAILIYITIRFEFKYAVSAICALTHDVLVALGVLTIFHKLGAPIQIDMRVIAAIMTIIGYSLNNTIIIFDRIREDAALFRKLNFHDIVNKALNETLGRTVITSGTTLAVLVALLLISGASIFSFAFVMTIGVIIGTFSSLFVAPPILLHFHKKGEKEKEE